MSSIVNIAKKIENKVSRAILPGPLGELDRKYRGKIQDYVMNGKKKDPMRIDQGQLSDLSVQSSAYGSSVPQILGPWRVSGEIIWATAKRPTPHVETQTAGGKGGLFGGGSQDIQTTTYTYSVSLAIGLADCRDGNQIAGIAKIWANGKLIYNIGAGATYQSYIASLSQASAIRFYPGSSTQSADALITATETVAPAWRGLAYVVIENLQLGEWDNAVPNLEFEVIPVGTSGLQLPYLDVVGALQAEGGTYNGCELSIMNDGNIALALFKSSTGKVTCSIRNPYDLSLVRSLGAVPAAQISSGFRVNQYGEMMVGNVVYLPSGATITIGIDFHSRNAMDLAGNFYIACRYFAGSPQRSALFIISPGGVVRQIDLPGGPNELPSDLTIDYAGGVYLFCNIGSSGPGYTYKFDAASGAVVKKSSFTTIMESLVVAADGALWYHSGTGAQWYKTDTAWSSDTLLWNQGPAGGYDFYRQWARDWERGGVVSAFHSSTRRWAQDGSYEIVNASPADGEGCATHPGFPGRVYHYYRNMSFTPPANRYVQVWKQVLTGGSVAVSAAISRLCAAAGLAVGEIDVTAVTAAFGGGARPEQMTARGALEPLLSAFMLQVVDTGAKLRFAPYGSASVATIPIDDVMMVSGSDDYTAVLTDDQQESELPSEVQVQFRDSGRNYLSDAQYARRLVTTSRHIETLQYQLVMTATQAMQLAHAKLFERWVARKSRRFALSRKWAKLECGDVITVPVGSSSVTVLLRSIKDDGVRRICDAEDNEAAVFTQSVAGNAGASQSTTVGAVSPMLSQLLDVALARDGDDDHGMYVAAGGVLAGWTGGRLYKSTDGGVTYSDTNLTFTSASVTGTTLGVLGSFASGNIFDELNTVDVVVSNGAMASITEAQALADIDMLLIGNEFVTPKNRVLIATNTYRLSGFLRGRRGTEWAMGLHAAGERVVVMSTSAARNLAMASSEVGQSRAFKGVSFGGLLATATQQTLIYRAERLRPRAPAALWGGRDASGNITGALIRSARRGTAWANLINVPLDESTEAYEVDVFAGTALTVSAVTKAVNAEFTVTGTLPAVGDPVYVHSLGGMTQLNERAFTVVAITAANKFTINEDSTNWGTWTSGGSVLKRKPSGVISLAATTAWSYSSAQQVTDYGSNQATVRAAAYQISARVGRGIARTAII